MSSTIAPMTKLSPLNPTFARSPLSQSSPSSPLSPTSSFSSPTSPTSGARLLPKRGPSFPSSRPLRPFASVKTAISKPTVKIIQPPAGLCGPQFFVLDMTQGELARQA
ncbi:hypothetical protein M407DRAFT_240429 [Tulasnella calospora MUT 4182]|uniref:Uncharacterized protein n=1 Tax=Tulasnella calospora MUT 4182 TaxID=1051891 RepID=A0A0C3QX13_9AGAM|nr:hypothetical protein M407DRAFT_240429 [Tulasnella calospora MUT 4182]